MTTAIKSVSVSLELAMLAEKYKISFSEACRIGMSMILSDMGEPQYLNATNFGRKIMKLSQNLQEVQDKLNNVLENQ